MPGKSTTVPASFQTWSELLENDEARHGGLDDMPYGGHLTTVFFGLDHSWGMAPRPALFETAYFDPAGQVTVLARYATWAEAEAGHAEWRRRLIGQAGLN